MQLGLGPARHGQQLLADLQGFLVVLADLLDSPGQLFLALVGQLLADERIAEGDHVAHRHRAAAYILAQRQNLLDHQGRAG